MCSCKSQQFNITLFTWIFLAFTYRTYGMGELAKCAKVAAVAAWRDHNTVVETSLKTLAGTWTSEGCETRPGPEYVLRLYTFNNDGSYFLVQHHYWDDSCSSPKLTVISHGRITLRNSLVQPEASNGMAKPINITVVPEDTAAAEELSQLVAKECPRQYWKSWKRNEEHIVYDNKQGRHSTYNLWSHSYQSITNHHNLPTGPQKAGSISCLGSLKWAFNELKLVKIQFRPFFENRTHPRHMEMELLLGDIHTNKKRREFYSPTSFQVPLLKQNKEENITIDKHFFIVKSSNTLPTNFMTNVKTPPHLNAKPHLPPYIWGEWTSTRCESRPMDVYLIRHFSFYEEDFHWVGEHKFFSDPFCTYPKFIVTAMGHFTLAGASEVMKGITNIDFQIERATLTALEEQVIYEMRLPGICGIGDWKVNFPKELATTSGCLPLGIFIPSIRYDIVKVEMDYKGSWLLFLGQADTNNFQTTAEERPTAFQLPLIKCGQKVSFSENFKESFERRFYFGLGSLGERICNNKIVLIFSLLLIYVRR